MTFEQIADEITPHNTRVLGATVSCGVSARIRMSLFMSSFYTYGMLIIHIHLNLLRIFRARLACPIIPFCVM